MSMSMIIEGKEYSNDYRNRLAENERSILLLKMKIENRGWNKSYAHFYLIRRICYLPDRLRDTLFRGKKNLLIHKLSTTAADFLKTVMSGNYDSFTRIIRKIELLKMRIDVDKHV